MGMPQPTRARIPADADVGAQLMQQWFPLYGGWYAQDTEDTSLPKVERGYIIIMSFYNFSKI